MGSHYHILLHDPEHNSVSYRSFNDEAVRFIQKRSKSMDRIVTKMLAYETLSDDLEREVTQREGKQIRYDQVNGKKIMALTDEKGARMIVSDKYGWDFIFSDILPSLRTNYNIATEKIYHGATQKKNGYQGAHAYVWWQNQRHNHKQIIEVQVTTESDYIYATEGGAAQYHKFTGYRGLPNYFKVK